MNIQDEVEAVLERLDDDVANQGMSYAEAARRSGMDRSDVSKLLRREFREGHMPKLRLLAKLAHGLGYRVKLVLGRL